MGDVVISKYLYHQMTKPRRNRCMCSDLRPGI